MQILYEEDGSIKVASVLADNTTSLQVEAPHGKRSKIKANAVLLKFEQADILHFMAQAEEKSAEIDVDFLWEVASPEEFAFGDLAQEYYGRKPDALEATSVILKLHHSPMYFYKKGKGKYKAAPQDALKAALASIEKKRVLAELKEAYVEALVRFTLPPDFSSQLETLLYKPDRNSLEFKALLDAAAITKLSPLQLLEKCGALPSIADYHHKKFVLENYPQGTTEFPEYAADPLSYVGESLPLAEAKAFSIDDFSTTEIDDAFSVARLPSGNWRVGIHISAPAVGILPASSLDELAALRLSTVYMPGNKITMLPDDVVKDFSLLEGEVRPVVSMYLEVSASDYAVTAIESRVEQIAIDANLRHGQLAESFNELSVVEERTDFPFGEELQVLWHLAQKLVAVRGKENTSHFKEYDFVLEGERIIITERKRDTPIDKVVSELMIYVNSKWAEQLSSAGVAAIYRIQENGKTRMDTTPGAHSGLGVTRYAWASSPLRRYIDLINQRQIMSLIQGASPYYSKEHPHLSSTLRNFDIAYEAYNDFQRNMERYWCLRYLLQENTALVRGNVIRDNLVRFATLPLVTKVNDLPSLPADAEVELNIVRVDLLELNVECRYHKPAEQLLAATGT